MILLRKFIKLLMALSLSSITSFSFSSEKLGILSGIPQELVTILSFIKTEMFEQYAGRNFTIGELSGRKVVATYSLPGKVAAASAASILIERYEVEQILMIGVAGAVDPQLNIGDVIVANTTGQHDLDATGIGFDLFEVPLLGIAFFNLSNAELSSNLMKQVNLNQNTSDSTSRSVRIGLIMTGDQFITNRSALPQNLSLQAVDMESAAVAQVGFEHGIPVTVVRMLSDTANERVNFLDFSQWVTNVAAPTLAEFSMLYANETNSSNHALSLISTWWQLLLIPAFISTITQP